MPPQTPQKVNKRPHFETPVKAGMQAIYGFYKANNMPCTERDIAAYYDCAPSAVYRAITGPSRKHLATETRGPKRIITDAQLEV